MRIATAVLAAAVCGATPAAASAAGTLAFCLGADNAPMSSERTGSGVEVDLARRLAARLGVEPRFVWVGASDPELLDVAAAVRDGRCDAAFGAIVPSGPVPAGGTLPKGLAMTPPYHAAGFVLIRRSDGRAVRTLDAVGRDRIGVERDGVVNLLLRQRGRRVEVLSDAPAIVERVASGAIGYGYLWGPVAATLVRGRPDVEIASEFIPVDRWSIALVVRSGAPYEAALARAIRQLTMDGGVERIFTVYGVPYLAPE